MAELGVDSADGLRDLLTLGGFPEPGRPALLVESKWGDDEVDRSLRYLKQRFPDADAWQVSAVGRNDYRTPEGIRVAPALALLKTLV